jgi:hypothetical protein
LFPTYGTDLISWAAKEGDLKYWLSNSSEITYSQKIGREAYFHHSGLAAQFKNSSNFARILEEKL